MKYNTFAKAHDLHLEEYLAEREFIRWAIDYYCLSLSDLRKISSLILELCSEEGVNDIN